MPDTEPLEDTVEQMDEVAEKDGEADIRSLIESFGDRTFGPVLIALGLLALSPFGAIPGIPAVLALSIVLFAAQVLFGRQSPWLPGVIADIEIKEDQIAKFQSSAGQWLSRFDRVLRTRLQFATGGVARKLAAITVIAQAIIMIPLEAIPFAVAIPAVGIVLFGAAIAARDGLVMLLAGVISGISGVIVFGWLL